MTSGPSPARPFYLQAGLRRLFCLHHVPTDHAQGAIVYVPPFAEEMNKSRRMAALQARALASAGWHVLQLDLTGTGDSSGDFSDATWQLWVEDVNVARAWLARSSGVEPWLWGLRLGALLASCSLMARPAPGQLMWQPVLSGRQHLQQLLRVKAGAEWLNVGQKGNSNVAALTDQQAPRVNTPGHASKPFDQLMSGHSVEVAGYTISPALAVPMSDAALQVPAGLDRLVLLEVSPHGGASLSPAATRMLAVPEAPADTLAAVVQGPSFWQAQEVETAPDLLAATNAALRA